MADPIDVTLVTCDPLPEPDLDQAPLLAALKARGLRVRVCAWDDEDVDWGASTVTLLRSTWDYYRRYEEFLAWLKRVQGVTAVQNPPEVIRWNTDKRYLLTLPMRGVPIVPTVFVERGSEVSLRGVCDGEGWEKVVVKPAVSAGSFRTHFMESSALEEGVFAELLKEQDTLVQPFVESVETYGERSLIFFEGEFSHCVRKHPRFAGDDEKITGPHEPTSDELGVARAALDAVGETLLYGRVDLVRDEDDQPMLAELEVTEPSLFFRFAPGSVERFAEAIAARVS